MKKVMAVNASPRKNWNTALVLEKALEGAAEAGAETKLIHLHGLQFSGCVSCFSCKRLEKTADICVVKDDLKPILEECAQADALIVGVPIYFSNLNAYAIAFLERLLFAGYTYNMETPSKFPKQIASALVCTMNATEEQMRQHNYPALMDHYTMTMKTILRGPSEWLAVTDTLQYKDYGKYMSSIFDPAHKARMREEKFPQDLEAAKKLGARLAAA